VIPTRFLAWLCNPRIVLALILVVSLAVVTQTYSKFSHTWDEPAHLAAGLELLDLGTYYYEHQHPPLARVATALGPYLAGYRSARASAPPKTDFWDRQLQGFDEGRRLLYEVGPYDRVLTLARLGILPFLLVALLATYAWARSLFGEWPAVLAVFLLATVPPFLGNAGLATLDVPFAALGVASLFAFCHWLDRPRGWTAAALGVVTGGAIMAKFSAIPFLAVSFTAIALWRTVLELRRRRPILSRAHLETGALSVAAILLVFWLCYGFGFTSLADPANRPYESVERLLGRNSVLSNAASGVLEIRLLPNFVPEIWKGINDVRYHNRIGHLSFLLGEVRTYGWWYYYLVALGVKTPLTLLIVGLGGLALLLRASARERDWRVAAPVLGFVSILCFASAFSSINIGIRHVLILYPLLAIAASHAILCLVRTVKRKTIALTAVTVVVALQAASLGFAHPDHMAYFNRLAGSHPERILLSADLDWGQDLKRLERELRRRGVDRVAVAYYGSARLAKHDLPGFSPLPPYTPQTGWIAVSLWKLRRNEDYSWLRTYEPVARVGTSINLYYVADTSAVRKPFVGELAPGVFMRDLNGSLGSNQAFIVFDRFVVVFDPSTVVQARQLLQEIRARTAKPVRYVINSHFHADHSAGATIFAALGAEVVAAAAGRNDFEVWARRDFAHKTRTQGDVYQGLEYAPPTRYLETPWVLDDGVQRLELIHYGHGHTSGDLVGWLPRHRILLAGDLSTNGQHNLANASVSGWIAALEQLRALRPVLVVPGHRQLAGPEILDKSHRYLAELRAQVRELVARGRTYDEVLSAVDIPFYEKWSGVAVRDERTHVARAYAEAGGVWSGPPPLMTTRRIVWEFERLSTRLRYTGRDAQDH
jgi:glyoxylase-like metal-dependent hydrolase (beta-lactamase superfamily II)/4-amino-4-deoxy-L-arabinose transferase-like glycosyltransferase